MGNNILWIDAIKGFTILLVILGHCLNGYLTANMFGEYKDTMNFIHRWIYSFHMPLFFIISGFLYQYAYRDFTWAKLKYKVFNLAIIYFIFSILQVCVQIIFGSQVNRNYSFIDILLLPFYTVPPYWYLYVLIFFYILSFFINKGYMNFVLLISFIFSYFNFFHNIGFCQIGNIEYYFFFFLLGAYLCIKKDIFYEYNMLLIPLLVLYFLYCIYGGEYYNKFVDAFVLSITSIIFFNNLKILFSNKVFLLCGKYCLPIYLLHCYMTAGTRIIYKYLGISNISIYIASGMILGVLVPVFFYKFCEKYSSLNILFKPIKFLIEKKIIKGV